MVFFLFSGVCFADELLSGQALNYFQDGLKAQKVSKYAEAKSFYQKAMLVDPYNKDWKKFFLNNEGIIQATQGDLKEAEKYFIMALDIDPYYYPSLMNLGLIYDRTRSRKEAMEYWMKAFEIDKIKPKDFVVERGPSNEDAQW